MLEAQPGLKGTVSRDFFLLLYFSRPGSLVSEIPAGDGKNVNLFLQCRSFLLSPVTGRSPTHKPGVTGLVKHVNWGHVRGRNFTLPGVVCHVGVVNWLHISGSI